MHLIQSLASKELVRNLHKIKFDQHFCDAFKIRKPAYATHKAKNIVSTTRCLELLHMDLFSPSAIWSYGGNRYTLVIVDDYSRYTWTRLLKDKTDAFDQFEIFSKKIQNQLGCTIVSIRTDHGREFDNEVQFGELCKANGITHNFSAPCTPQSNDEKKAIKVTENKNLENDIEDETLEIDEIVNIKESRNHPLENVFRNKLDENGIVFRNKARLVAQGYNQQEGIDYDEPYAPVARLESIRILLAYACALDFKLFQMDVKSAFLNGFINEEDLKQAPKAWYDRLKTFLIKHEYKIGMVDNTLFTKKKSSNLIIVQIYVDDIIFGLTCQDMRDEFAKIMYDEFEMSMMGELNIFIGLQIKQMEDGSFFIQSKYIKEIHKKFGLEESKPMKTLMSSDTKLTEDEECESVDSTKYRGMIGSLLYLTASRPDIMFSVCLCARFQEAPKTSHLKAVKCIFRYIKGTTHLGLWYPKGTGIETVVYTDSDHAGDYVDRKSTDAQESGTLVTKMSVPVTAEEKANEKNDVKARSLLLMTLPNEHQLTFSQYPDGKPQQDDTGFVDSGCSRYMTGNIAYLSGFKEFDGGYVTFGGGAHGGRIFGSNFSISQMCDKKNYVFFTDTECLVLSPKFKLPDENQILLKIPRKDNMYSFDIKNIVPKESLTCLVTKATLDESMLWHMRLCHINFENINKLVKDNLVRGLPKKCFEKGIKREYSVARTPQQNGVAERRNRTLIEAARTMLTDSKLPTTFWAEAVSTACYV
ncbi:retrovirus-related pol polyprotein from transposon TNT 1-94 [Tanacetum coccineum]